MINWLKWKIAGREMAELERWRIACGEAQRWLAEFPDVSAALDHVECVARGVENPKFISDVREEMRNRRDRRDAIMAPLRTKPMTRRQYFTEQCGWTDEAVTDVDLDALAAHVHIGGAPGETTGPQVQTLMRAVPVNPSFPDGPAHGVPATEWDVSQYAGPLQPVPVPSSEEMEQRASATRPMTIDGAAIAEARRQAQAGWLTWEAFYAAWTEANLSPELHLGMSVPEAYARVTEAAFGQRRQIVDPYPLNLAILWRDVERRWPLNGDNTLPTS